MILLSAVAFLLAVLGFVELLAGNGWWAIAFWIAACAVGPGGWTIWRNH